MRDILELFCIMLLVAVLMVLTLMLAIDMRHDIVVQNRKRVRNAIISYMRYCEMHHKPIQVDYVHDMEDFDDTLYRFYDWGCKNILPKEKYDLVKAFMNE